MGGLVTWANLAHRPERVFDILRRAAEQKFLVQEVGLVVLDLAAAVEVLQLDTAGGEPLAVRMLRRQFLLDFTVVPDLSFLGIDQQHLAGLQTALALNLGRVEVQDADFAGEDQDAALGDGVATGAQTVAVLDAAGVAAVAEQERGRAVPRFHQDGMILVEGAQVLRNRVRLVEAFRHQDGHRLREAETAQGQELQDVVQAGRVAHVRLDDRRKVADVAQRSGVEHALTGLHPAAVAADGVDLAVVAEHPERLRQAPLREGVRREAGMDDRHRAGEPLARQVRIVFAQLTARQHALVHDVPGGQGADVAILSQPLDVLADAVELALEIRVLDELIASHEDLRRVGLPFRRVLSEAGGIDGDFPDMAQDAALVFHLRSDGLQDTLALGGVLGQEHQARTIPSLFRDGNTLEQDEFVGNLDQDAGSVARLSVGALGAAVAHVLEHRQGIVNQLVGLVAADVDDHTNPTGIVFRCRVV